MGHPQGDGGGDTAREARAEERHKEEEDVGAAPELVELTLANRELERLKAENEKRINAAKGTWCGLLGVIS